MEMIMKKLLLSAAFAAVLATPAFAQSYNPDFGTGNVNPPVASLHSNEAGSAFAYEPRTTYRRAVRHPHAVYDSYGEYPGHQDLRRDSQY